MPGGVAERDVLIASRRRCCLCFFLNGVDEVRKGQIAHLNRDRSDSRFENLVYLCLEHHDEYDSRTSQSRGFSAAEVRDYRDRLYAANTQFNLIAKHSSDAEDSELSPLQETTDYQKVRKNFHDQLSFTLRTWRSPLWQVANEPELFAYKAGNGMDGVCLIERIDIPDGRIVLACIDVAGNPGNSITNCVEELCFQVCERFDIPTEKLVWLEHYDTFGDAEWNVVTFSQFPPNGPFQDPKWSKMTPAMWRSLRLRPKKRLKVSFGHFESKLDKLFPWPDKAILDEAGNENGD